MSKLSFLSKFPGYVDELVDIFWLSLQAVKAYRQESPYFDMIAFGLFFIATASLISFIRGRLKKKI